MDDTGLVARFESLGHLPRDGERFLDRNRSFSDALGERRTFDELENERLHAVRFFQTVNARDVRMVQRREELGLALEPRQALFVSRELFGKNLDRYVAGELPIACPIDLASSR